MKSGKMFEIALNAIKTELKEEVKQELLAQELEQKSSTLNNIVKLLRVERFENPASLSRTIWFRYYFSINNNSYTFETSEREENKVREKLIEKISGIISNNIISQV